MAADDDRHRAIDRFRLHMRALELKELAVIGWHVGGPQFPHHADIFVRRPAPRLERCVDGSELLFHPADADAQQHATAGHVIQGRDLFGRHHRIALRHDQDAGAEINLLGPRRDITHPDEWVRQRDIVFAARHLAVIGVGVL